MWFKSQGSVWKPAKKIVTNAGFEYDDLNVIVLVANVNGNDFDYHCDCLQKSVEVIDEHLRYGKPIIVGVDYKDGSANFDGVTDHWVVITARGKDETGVFYNYFEVAKNQKKGGISKDNKLYLQSTGVLKGKCT